MGLAAIFGKLGAKFFGRSAAKVGSKAAAKTGTKLSTKILIGAGITGGLSLGSWWSGLTQEGGALEWVPVIPDLGEWLSGLTVNIQDYFSRLFGGDLMAWVPIIAVGAVLFAVVSVFRRR